MLLEFRIACYGDSEKCSLSARRCCTLAEEKESICHPAFLSSVFKDPLPESRRGPTYISVVTVLDRVVSLEGPGPVVFTD